MFSGGSPWTPPQGTKDLVKKYGATQGRPGCTYVGRTHTEKCRARLETGIHRDDLDSGHQQSRDVRINEDIERSSNRRENRNLWR